MKTISVSAHFDGERIHLDERVELSPRARLIVTILPDADEERDDWFQAAMQRFNEAYNEDEEDYPLDSIIEKNPNYEGI
ncbi:MAG: hypothetical protein GC154_17085 [bacterium]|nr:hypothetical protein [bacterium]